MNQSDNQPVATNSDAQPELGPSRPSSAPELGRFAARISSLAREAGGYSALARSCGVSESVVRKWARGESEPSRSHLVALAHAAGVSLTWLGTGQGPRAAHVYAAAASSPALVTGEGRASGHAAAEATDDALVYVPLYDVQVGAGNGAVIEREQLLDQLAFRSDWVRREIGAEVSDLLLVYVRGDSMEAVLREGDVIMLDRRDRGPSRDGIYCIRVQDAVLVKTLQRLPGGVVKVSSENRAYEPFTFGLNDRSSGVYIIGRVVWRAGKL